MNKNWLYRILAIALVAMLALPVFAMAEEVETFDLGGEEGVELIEKKLSYTEAGDTPYDWDSTNYAFDFDGGSQTFSETIDLANLGADDANGYPAWLTRTERFTYVNAMSTWKKTNSNSKVATVSSAGVVTLTGKTGKTKITFTAKGANTNAKATCTINLTVKNTMQIKLPDFPEKMTVGFTNTPAADTTGAFNSVYSTRYADGIHATEDPAGSLGGPLGFYYLTFKSSNSSVLGVEFTDDAVAPGATVFGGTLVAKKAGTAKITVRAYHEVGNTRPMLLATVTKTVKVLPNKFKTSSADEKACLKAAKIDEELYVGVRSAEYTKVDTATGKGTIKITFFVCNGTGNPIKKIYGNVSDPVDPANDTGVAFSAWKYNTARDMRLDDRTAAVTPDDVTGAPSADWAGLFTAYPANGKSVSVNWPANGKKIGTFTVTCPNVDIIDLNDSLTRVECDTIVIQTSKTVPPQQFSIKQY